MKYKIYAVSDKPLELGEVEKTSGFSSPDYLWTEQERMSPCSECGSTAWILVPTTSEMVRQGGKRYLICLHCGSGGMHL
ncbi:MAG: hypothetical protein WC976_06105 [Caldisericia bacterium]